MPRISDSNTTLPKGLFRASLLLSTLVFVGLFFLRFRDPAIADDVDLILPLEIWLKNGPNAWGVWHSPFYPWIVFQLQRLIQNPVAASRVAGCVTTLITAALIAKSVKLTAHRAVTRVLALTLLCPVALGASLIIDFDNTVLTAATALYFYFLIRDESKPWFSPQRYLLRILAAGVCIGLCLSAKETTPLIYPLALIFAWKKNYGIKRAWVGAVLAGTLGVCFFVILSGAWCHYYNISWSAIFRTDLINLKNKGVGAPVWGWEKRAWIALFPVLWVGLPLVFGFLFKLPQRILSGGAWAGVASVCLLILFAYTAVFQQTTYYFPKYMVPALLWIPALTFSFERSEEKMPWYIVVLAIVWGLLTPSALLAIHEKNLSSLLLSQLYWVMPLVMIFALQAHRIKRKLVDFVFLSSLALTGSILKDALSATDRSLSYWYGDSALSQIRDYPLADGIKLTAAKDLYLATRSRGVEYATKEQILQRIPALCAQERPVTILSRVREDTSVSAETLRSAVSSCFRVEIQGDLAVARKI